MKFQTLTLLAGMLASAGTHAVSLPNNTGLTPYDLGDFGAPTTWSNSFTVSMQGAIAHDLTFSITENLYAGSGIVNIPLSWDFGNFTVQFTNITGLDAKIYDSTNTLYKSFTQVSSGYLTLPASTYFATGDYTLKIVGNATGSGNPTGMYTIAAVTAPVPEPETWGMLLAGLGLVGLRLRQKIRGSDQTMAA